MNLHGTTFRTITSDDCRRSLVQARGRRQTHALCHVRRYLVACLALRIVAQRSKLKTRSAHAS